MNSYQRDNNHQPDMHDNGDNDNDNDKDGIWSCDLCTFQNTTDVPSVSCARKVKCPNQLLMSYPDQNQAKTNKTYPIIRQSTSTINR